MTLPALGVLPPATQRPAKDVIIDAFHDLVYAVTAGAVYERLDHNR
ncbi:MAG: hypothetical protein ACYCO9_21290 [Streptosporangiaceae bacterium]